MAATLLYGRCNPYGAEDGGPRHVMGGLHGPGSAATPGRDLPDNVAQGEWLCPQPAVIRVKMTCNCGHEGRVMALCSYHDETVVSADPVAGITRKVKSVKRVPGHYEEIQRRQAGACIRCLYPGEFASAYKDIEAWQGELAYLRDLGMWHSEQANRARSSIENLVGKFDRGNATGEIHRCPMRLIPVS
jgi:hypothetical protein